MTVQTLDVKITGANPLLMNNPRTVDRFDKYAKAMAVINAKKTSRTDEDYLEMRNIEMRAKLFFNPDLYGEGQGGVYVPSTWVIAGIAKNSNLIAKLGKEKARGGVFPTDREIPLEYENRRLVSSKDDIVGNPFFRHLMCLKQGQIRVMKASPIFHKWSFKTQLDFDDAVIDRDALERVLVYCAKYGGFGDFRPTFGRGTATFGEEAHG